MTKAVLALGMRVRHKATGQSGLIVGPSQHGIGYSLIPVALENSTRQEVWPEHLCVKRRVREQLPAHGGNYKPPKGFPLNT
tara:strand:- start:101 stop:343 length:243 start_codon:yes stop_codon:yes gene_type:complete